MIKHIIRMTVRTDVSDEQVATALHLMAQASEQVAHDIGITDGLFGRDFGGAFDLGAVSTMDSLETYRAMMNHPAHLDMDRIGLPLVSRFHSIDITDDPDPLMGEHIAEIHRERYAAHPELLALVHNIDDYVGSGVPQRA